MTSEGKPFKNISNVGLVLEYHPELNRGIAWNESTHSVVSQRALCSGRIKAGTTLDDYHLLELTAWIQAHTDVKVNPTVVIDAVNMVGRRYSFHPLRDYLKGLGHDGNKRVDNWLTKYLGVANNDYTIAVGRCWLISAVARVMEPGCKADCCLILEGETGLGKSTAFSVLGGEWFSDSLRSMDQNKESLMQLRGKWIIEIGELSQMSRGDITDVKHFMSTSIDNYRVPWGKKPQDVPRECVFGGTSNLNSYLKDETGNRRFWPVECHAVIDGKWIDRDGLRKDRDQLWAEAVAMYNAGVKWYLDDAAVLSKSVDEQESRLELDPWHEQVQLYCNRKADRDEDNRIYRVKIENILKGHMTRDGEILGIGKRVTDWTQPDRLRVGRILRLEGWTKSQKRVNGKVESVFIKPFAPKPDDK